MSCCACVKMLVNVVENDGNIKNSNKSNIYNVTILIVSLLSVAFDLFIGFTIVLQYYMSGKSNFAISTFSFIFIPLVIIQVFSIKLYFLNSDMKAVQWILHLLLLGFICRYITAMKKYVNNFKSVTCFASNSVNEDLNNLKNLYLFKCFMECLPQLILQLFILSTSNDLLFTRLLISSSALSLAWAFIIHTNFKKLNYCSLVWLILWRTGMISARISALVLCAHICGPWIILFLACRTRICTIVIVGSHWLAMILWITYQKSTENERRKNGEFHSAIFGLIYCFCFFSLKFGQSKWQAITLNLLFFFENLIFLTVFLTRFSVEQPKLAVLSFVIVISGSLLGMSSLLVYYLLFSTIRTGKCSSPVDGISSGKEVDEKNENVLQCRLSEEEHHRDVLSSSNSIIIIEENLDPDSNDDEKFEISKAKVENIYAEPNETETGNEAARSDLPAAIKRRAICSSVDLERLAENRTGNSEMEAEIVIADESASEILSTRDYENICAVNIAREPWGIRSWRGYSDIETFRHDDSVVNEGRLNNLTTSSEYSGKFEDKDSFISEDKCDINTISEKVSVNFLSLSSSNVLEAILEDEVMESKFEDKDSFISEDKCDINTISEKVSVNFLSLSSSNVLEAILEDEVMESNLDNKNDNETKCNGKSSLVATIDKICLYTPLRTRSRYISNRPDSTESGVISGKDGRDFDTTEKFSVGKKLYPAVEKKDFFSPLKDKFRPVQKLNIFRERYETNRYHIPNKSEISMVQANKTCAGKENFKSENNRQINRIKYENGATGKASGFKENCVFFKEIFTPSKTEQCSFRISYTKR